MRRELERIDIPGEHEARERAWTVVLCAFEQREPAPRPFPYGRWLVVAAAAAAVAGGAVSAPGRAVLGDVREALRDDEVGAGAVRLAAPGRVLVNADSGAWIVHRDGSKRRLGAYRDAAWSPFGRYVAAARGRELVALDSKGAVRWTLPRPQRVSLPSWGGNRDDTRIAYLSGRELRVTAGDGTDDRILATRASPVAPAWRPGPRHVVAFATPDGLFVKDADTGAALWGTNRVRDARRLSWSSDGRRLLVQRARFVDFFSRDGRLVTGVRIPGGRVTAAAFRPGSHAFAYAQEQRGRAHVVLVDDPGRVLFTGSGRFADLVWSPDGRWLLVSWPTARQWVFVRAAGRPRLQASADVAAQFSSREFPRTAGWVSGE